MTGYRRPQEQQWAADQNVLFQRVAVLERQVAALTFGSQPALPTSSTHPASPTTGMPIYETDTGLEAYWSGTAWVYPPQLIAKQVLTASAASVTFSGIPQGFTNLRLLISARSDGTGASGYDAANLQLNGVTSGYNWNTIWSPQSSGTISATGGTSQSSMQCAEIWNSHFGTVGRGIATIDIPNYASGSGLRGFTSQSAASDGGAAGITQIYSGCSNITGAITSLTVLMGAGNFIAPSEFSLYGL